MNILVVEDDPVIAKAIVQGFSEAGHDCRCVQDGATGTELALEQQEDAIVLDLMLPKKSGMEMLQEIRSKGIQTPVIVLTAKGSLDDRVAGLDSGADDYLVKPFAFAELLARVHSVVRRSTTRPSAVLTGADITLDLTTRRVTRDGQDIDLTPTEFSLLELLLRYAGQVVTRKMLCEHVWGFDWDGPTNVIEVHVNRLRRKLDKGQSESTIKTIRGRGYSVASAS